MNNIEKDLLLAVADLHQVPSGAYNIRQNGKSIDRNSTKNIEIVPKKEKNGIDIIIKPNTINESVHIPVIISESGIEDLVYNDFYIGENSDVLIVAGCGIHNPSEKKSEHAGIHSFHLEKNAKVRYVEKHIASGQSGEKIFNPETNIEMKENSQMEMETTQLGGVTSSVRETKATLEDNAKLIIKEKVLTSGDEYVKTMFEVTLKGENSSVEVISRGVARDTSKQVFYSNIMGENKCFGHVECDAILMDKAMISSTPVVSANNVDATLTHEAAIGKIAGEQLIKLQTLGLTAQEAEEKIVEGFLK